jgi:hypothetical protein
MCPDLNVEAQVIAAQGPGGARDQADAGAPVRIQVPVAER